MNSESLLKENAKAKTKIKRRGGNIWSEFGIGDFS